MTSKAKRLAVAQLCEFEAGHDIYKELLGKASTGEDMIAGVRLSKADVLGMTLNGKTIFEYPQVMQNFHRLAAAVAASPNGGPFTARDLTRTVPGQQRSILDYAERAGALEKVFSPEIWAGRDTEMHTAWFEVPRFNRNNINFLELRRAVAAAGGNKLREDHLTEMGLPPGELSSLLLRGEIETIQQRLAPHGERLRREDVMLIDNIGETVLNTSRDIWNHIGKIQAALYAHNEQLGMKEFLRKVGGASTGLEAARQAKALTQLFSPEIWRGRPEEMMELQRHATELVMQGVDIRSTLDTVLAQSEKGRALTSAPASMKTLTETFNCEAVPDAQVETVFRPLGMRATWNRIGEIRAELRAKGEKIMLADLRLPCNLEGDTCLSSAVRYGHLSDVLSILEESGEFLTIEDMTARKKLTHDMLINLIADTKQFPVLFRAENWVGRIRDLQELWKNVPVFHRTGIDFGQIQSDVNRLSLRRAAGRNPAP